MLERKENIVMYVKIGKKIVEVAVPILSDIVREEIAQGIFASTIYNSYHCDILGSNFSDFAGASNC